MIWISLDVPPPWAWLVIAGVFAVLSVVVFRVSFDAYDDRRYFFNKALKLAFWRTLGWLALNGGSFCIVFWLINLIFPESGWWAYLAGGGVWWLLSNTLLAAGMHILDYRLEKS